MKIKTKTDANRIILPSIDDVPGEYWAGLAKKKIFFGHQSVGYNVIAGIKDVITERDYVKLNIVETSSPAQFDKPILAHARVGRNTVPASKTDGFCSIIKAGIGNKTDIAFFKFCYVDLMHDCDPQKIFDDYTSTIEELKMRYPETKFLHVTVPISSMPKGAKRTLKESIKLLTDRVGILDHNIKRQQYNTLLRQAYSKDDTVFDLALIESVNPDGFRCYAKKGTEKVFVMADQYTSDGGHLNEQGRKKVAEQFLIVLAETANNLD